MEQFNSDVIFDYINYTITPVRDTRPSDLLTSYRVTPRFINYLALPDESLQENKTYYIENWIDYISEKQTHESLRHRSMYELIYAELPYKLITATLTEVRI